MRAAVDAVAAGDIDRVVQYFPENLVWHIAPGPKDPIRTYRGRDGLREFFEHFISRTPAGARLEFDDILANDRHGVLFLRMTLGDGTSMSLAHFAALDKDGEFARNWFLPSDWNAAYKVLFEGVAH
jgi:ketosteroid isomerase-like protein